MGRVEILTGVERRRKWSEEQKLSILEEVATNGLPVAEIARRHDLIPQQIYRWRRQFVVRAEEEPQHFAPSFLPVSLVAPEQDGGGSSGNKRPTMKEKPQGSRRGERIEIRCKGGRVLKVDAGLNLAVLQGLIRSVEEA